MQILSNLGFIKYYDKMLTAANDCKIVNINYSDQQCIETVLDSNLDLHVLAFKELLYVCKGRKLYKDMLNKNQVNYLLVLFALHKIQFFCVGGLPSKTSPSITLLI